MIQLGLVPAPSLLVNSEGEASDGKVHLSFTLLPLSISMFLVSPWKLQHSHWFLALLLPLPVWALLCRVLQIVYANILYLYCLHLNLDMPSFYIIVFIYYSLLTLSMTPMSTLTSDVYTGPHILNIPLQVVSQEAIIWCLITEALGHVYFAKWIQINKWGKFTWKFTLQRLPNHNQRNFFKKFFLYIIQ